MSIDVNMGDVKLGTTASRSVDISSIVGVVKAKPSCGSCTKVTELTPSKLSFAFSPDQLGTVQKSIFLKDSNDQTVGTVVFKASVV